MSNSDLIRVLYIMGAGRSGSTVLDTVLGSHPDTVSVGEFCHLAGLGWTKGNLCSCGQRGHECEFWQSVREQWARLTDNAEVSEYVVLRKKFEQLRHGNPLPWIRLRHESRRPSDEFQRFLDLTYQLFVAVQRVSGKSIIVDSSKNPLRAEILSRIPGVDLKIVHLVRDGRAVAWSRKKAAKTQHEGLQRDTNTRPAWFSVAHWSLVNLSASRVRRHHHSQSLIVRYEDFVQQPREELQRIGQLAGINFDTVADDVVEGTPLAFGHIISGNRIRFNGSLRLRPDLEWTSELSALDRRICWSLAGWLLRRYDYQRSNDDVAAESKAAA